METMTVFRDRKEAGELLAKRLEQYAHTHTVVYSLPRGGVPVGYEIAKVLKAPLDVVITRKIGHPGSPEYALFALTESGEMVHAEHDCESVGAAWLERQRNAELKEIKRRKLLYTTDHGSLDPFNKTVILVDDGIATGLSIRAAIRMMKKRRPKRVILAVPVAPKSVVEHLKKEVDEVVCLRDDRIFKGSVGAYYQNFPQLTDDEVIGLLRKAGEEHLPL